MNKNDVMAKEVLKSRPTTWEEWQRFNNRTALSIQGSMRDIERSMVNAGYDQNQAVTVPYDQLRDCLDALTFFLDNEWK